MNRDEAMARDFRNEPIESARELVFVLANVQRRRAPTGTAAWYLLNRLQRIAMAIADREEGRPNAEPSIELRLAALESYVDEIAEHPALSVPPLPPREVFKPVEPGE